MTSNEQSNDQVHPNLFVRPAPCSECPARGGFGLRKVRRAAIAESVSAGQIFPCHKETYDLDDEGSTTINGRACAGVETLHHRTTDGVASPIVAIENSVVNTPQWDPAPQAIIPWRDFSDWVENDNDLGGLL